MRRYLNSGLIATEAMKDERRKELAKQILNKQPLTKENKEELVWGHLRLALAIGGEFANKYPRIKEQEVIDKTIDMLIEAVDKIESKLKDEYITGYISNRIETNLKDVLDDHIMGMPRRTVNYRLKMGLNEKNKIIDELKQHNIPERNLKELIKVKPEYQYILIDAAKEMSYKDFRMEVRKLLYNCLLFPKRLNIDKHTDLTSEVRESLFTPAAKRTEVKLELKEILNKIAWTDIDEAIITLRSEGYTLEEVGERVGLGRTQVGHKLKLMEERFDKIWT